MMRRLGGIAIAAAVMAAGTWLLGWWALLVAAVAWQLADQDGPPWRVGVAASLGWTLLLAFIPLAPLGRLTARLAGVFQLAPWGMVVLELGYAALLGWSAARVTAALVGLRPSSSRR